MWVVRQGTVGPIVTVTLQETAPALFEYPYGTVIATHLNGSLCDDAAPATAGEIVSFWATGLGPTYPKLQDGVLPAAAQPLYPMSAFGISINGAAVDPDRILYAGVAPGFAGLYQVNVQLPDDLPANPKVQFSIGGIVSPGGQILPSR